MKLSHRLQMIAQMIPRCHTVADVGCDHGYLPIALVKSQVCDKAYAMDVNKGPLEKAEKNIGKAGLEQQIKTILSDGLTYLPDDVDTLVIAGMGGMLMERILWTHRQKLDSIKALVLSPHLDDETVRRVVHKLGFVITKEQMVMDQGKYYTVMLCLQGDELYTDIEYRYGKRLIEDSNVIWLDYMESEIQKRERVIGRLRRIDSSERNDRLVTLMNEVIEMKEVVGLDET